MMRQVGVWLDRSKAVIVSVNEIGSETVTLTSDIEAARHPKCGTKGRCTIIAERRLRNRKAEMLKKFYRRIIKTIKNTESVLFFGPGPAKNEIVREFVHFQCCRPCIVKLETVDKMSSRKIELAIKKYYAKGNRIAR
jgi:hypothetical protein